MGQLSEEDSAEDSDSESGGCSDNCGDWAPLYRPHLSSHGNRAQLSDTERADPQDRGDKTREEGRGGEEPDSGVFVMDVQVCNTHLLILIRFR